MFQNLMKVLIKSSKVHIAWFGYTLT